MEASIQISFPARFPDISISRSILETRFHRRSDEGVNNSDQKRGTGIP